MKWRQILYLALGLAVLGAVFASADMAAVWQQVANFGALGLVVVIAIYTVEFSADVLAWQLALESAQLDLPWFRRLFLVRVVGEAFNVITPVGGMGGEPVKAMLLHKHYAVGYHRSTPSLVLAKTNSVIALVVFLSGGFLALLLDDRFSAIYKAIAGAGLATLLVAISAFFVVQRLRLASRLGDWLSRWHPTRRIVDVLHHVEDFDQRLVQFYARRRGHFLAAVALGIFNWFVGAFGIYVTFAFLDVPISLLDAWIIESLSQLVRAGAFFIPGALGAHEGALMIVLATLRGDPSAGLAAALIRRARELIWIAAGLGVGWRYSLQPNADGGNPQSANSS